MSLFESAPARCECETALQPGILVVDCDPAIHQVLRTALQTNGFHYWGAADGHQAIQSLRKNRAKIAVALIDLHLPEGGLAVLKSLRCLAPGLPCCLMAASAIGCDFTRDRLFEDEIAGMLFKPFKINHLVGVMQHLAQKAS